MCASHVALWLRSLSSHVKSLMMMVNLSMMSQNYIYLCRQQLKAGGCANSDWCTHFW